MRTSKREEILRTAIVYVNDHSLEELSYDSLASATGLSKSGLIYHFPSRHKLLLALHELLAADWNSELEELVGHNTDPATKLRAVVATLAENVSKPELLLLIDAPSHPDFQAAWHKVNHRWLPPAEDIENNELRRAIYLVQLAADGLFVHDYIHDIPFTPSQRQAMLDAVIAMIPADLPGEL